METKNKRYKITISFRNKEEKSYFIANNQRATIQKQLDSWDTNDSYRILQFHSYLSEEYITIPMKNVNYISIKKLQ